MDKRNFIWISSYPKSGNTWVSSTLEVAGRHRGFPQAQYDAYLLESTGRIPPVCEAVAEPYNEHPCSVLKTHSVYNPAGQPHYEYYPSLDATTVAFIHVYRNPLDVLLSYINFTRLEYKGHEDDQKYRKELFQRLLGYEKPFEYSDWVNMGIDHVATRNLDHALDYFSECQLGLARLQETAGTWTEHTQSWFDAVNDLPGYTIRYEDCLVDPGPICQLAGLFTFSAKRVEAAYNYVNKRTRRYSASGDDNSRVFFNKMDAYYFRKYFSPAAIERFCHAQESVLRKYGYAEILR